MQQLKGQSRAPDVLDMGTAFAIKADQDGLLAPYKVATWSAIPSNSKASDASWYADYGGYVAIGYNPAKVKVPPTSFEDLLKPIYKNQVAINGNPTQASAAFSAVYASALANGGSLSNIEPGIWYFKKLHQAGNFVPVTAGAATVQSGQTPIVVWWDYLLASEIQSVRPDLQDRDPDRRGTTRPTTARRSARPPRDPACARLWEEYLYSTTGPEPVAAGQGPADRAADADQRRNRQQDGLHGAAAGSGGRARLPEPGPGVGGRGQRGAAVVERDRLADDSERRSGGGPGVGLAIPAAGPRRAWPPALRRARALAGIVPFFVYILLFLGIPAAAIAYGAFQDPDTGQLHPQQRPDRDPRHLPARLPRHDRAVGDHRGGARASSGSSSAMRSTPPAGARCCGGSPSRPRGSSPTSAGSRWRSCSSPPSARPAWPPAGSPTSASTPTRTASTCTTSAAWRSSTCTSRSR